MAEMTLIVPASQQATCQALCAQLAGPPGAGMFVVGLSATGNTPATHYISTGTLEDKYVPALTDPSIMFAGCQAAGIQITLAQCTALLAACDISMEDPHTAMARMGLQLVQEDVGGSAKK